MRKLFWFIIIGACSIACSCADDLPEEQAKSRSVAIHIVAADTIVTDTLVFTPNTKMDFLREFYNKAWAFLIKCTNQDRGGYHYIEDPDYEDMIDFLTWATDTYESLHGYSEFDEVADLLGYTKVWNDKDKCWEIGKEEEKNEEE